jgi:adenylate cyclase
MPEERAQRHLAAILAADVVGYSRLMEADEAGTLTSLKARRTEILQPLIARHRGRIVKVMGDGVLVEFASAVDAVECAVALQEAMEAANAGLPEDRRIVLRIGINLGDVMVEGSDLYGDGVNIAARLEALADPGSVFVSQTVFGHVKGKTDLDFEDCGEQSLKNMPEPVRIYKISGIAASAPTAALDQQRRTSRQSIAVLPFVNMSGDPEQEYFSDGITEDIIAELSRFRILQVIARNSSFQFKGQAGDIREIGRRLGVRHIVEGSVRRGGDRLRITAQLINAANGGHLWSGRYDRDLRDVFEIQAQVAKAIVAAVAGNVVASGIAETRRKHTASFEAYDCFLRGLEHLNRSGVEDIVPAERFLRRAVEIDPNFAQGHALLVLCLIEVVVAEKWNRAKAEYVDALQDLLTLGKRAVTLDGADALCHCALAVAYLFNKRFELAEHHFGQAMRLNPNDADIIGYAAVFEMFGGRGEEALRLLEQAIELNPIPPNWYREIQGMALYALHRYTEAIRAFELETAIRPYCYRFLAACKAQLGEIDEARRLAGQSLVLQPQFTVRVWAEWEPYAFRDYLEHVVSGMRKAGLPE